MRPIQLLGLCPDGVHRYLYAHSRRGQLVMNRRMLALEYGTSRARFSECLDELRQTGLIVDKTPNPNVGLEHFQVAEPVGYDPNHERFGQLAFARHWVGQLGKGDRELTEEEMSAAIDFCEHLQDEIEDLYDLNDFDGQHPIDERLEVDDEPSTSRVRDTFHPEPDGVRDRWRGPRG